MGKMTLDEVRAAVKELSEDEQELLYLDLAGDMKRETPEHEKAWQEEIERRVAEIKSGSAVLYDGDEVMAEVRALVNEKL